MVGAVSGRLRPLHEISAFALAAVPVAGLLTWHVNYQPVFDLDRYLWIAGIVGVLGTGGGYALLWGARNPERWSLLSALYGAAVLALAYWRLRDIDLLLPWSIICLILSGVHLVFAERLRTWRFKDKFYRRAFGVHALACAGFLAAAVPLWVEREWLPVLWSLLHAVDRVDREQDRRAMAAARAVGRRRRRCWPRCSIRDSRRASGRSSTGWPTVSACRR